MKANREHIPDYYRKKNIYECGKHALPQKLPRVGDAPVRRQRRGVLENMLGIARYELFKASIESGENVSSLSRQHLRDSFQIRSTIRAKLPFADVVPSASRAEHLSPGAVLRISRILRPPPATINCGSWRHLVVREIVDHCFFDVLTRVSSTGIAHPAKIVIITS